MSDVSIPEMMYTMMSLLFLLLGIVLIASIVMSTINPYDQVAFANVERLRATIDQVCSTGADTVGPSNTIKFELPQNTPALTSVISVMPIWIINTNGDPNYVLYYESFSPGDATGWEIYQKMQNRIVTYLPEGWGDGDKTTDDVIRYVREVQDAAKAKNAGLTEGIIIGNIILNKVHSDFYLGENQKDAGVVSSISIGAREEDLKKSLGEYGRWTLADEAGVPEAGDNYFKFNNYISLNTFEKSAVKYVPCGPQSLCLKTRNGVYRFALSSSCSDIKGIQMVYDARDRQALYTGAGIGIGVCFFTGPVCGVVASAATSFAGWFGRGLLALAAKFIPVGALVSGVTGTLVVGGTTWTVYRVVENIGGMLLSYKVQDFSIASPCSIKEMTITKGACRNRIDIVWAQDQKACGAGDFNGANPDVMKYPLYEWGGDGKLHSVTIGNVKQYHYTCTEKVSNNIDTRPQEAFGQDDQCLQIKVVERASGFCWTPDPYRSSYGFADLDTAGLGKLGLTPTHEILSFLGSATQRSLVLKSYPMEKYTEFLESLRRKFVWGWPG